MKNFDYVCYATPNLAVIDALDDETLSDTTIFPPQETLDNCTVYKQFDESTTSLYSYLWKKIKIRIIFLAFVVCMCVIVSPRSVLRGLSPF